MESKDSSDQISWVTLYKYVSMLYLEEILNDEHLFLSDGTNFNDPFEISVENRNNHTTRHIEGLHILSLTNSYRKKLMWSHYTDSHKGACLTVIVPQRLVRPVCYSTRRIFEDSDIDNIILSSTKNAKSNVSIDFSTFSNNKKIAFIKDKKWIYEREYRIVFDKEDETQLINQDKKWFMPVKIKNVYLGVNFDKNDIDKKTKIKNICNSKNISVRQMALSDSNYALVVKE